MKKRIERMNAELATLNHIYDTKKEDFKAHINKLNSEIQALLTEKN